ncbi:helix-turn-helix domain-containing protein [Rubrobacter tropicus]|uniref:Helix-turn-helix domain-containing protein n=1 Tax=Rubrobacter tropicus TaxID=2653851 RepID=A0A6G8Q4Q9_9ACTN|nr:helix-turn-helix domain-containing protein [Rubrobacter tropicus]QIN81455.1 helix-turn-helix domain-containing protein [Rubrobacter tropicus]
MGNVSNGKKDLLDVAEVSEYLGVGSVTVYRWCREGRLPCLKVGKSWRIRRESLEDFLSRGERPTTLVGQLRQYLAVPDSVIAIAQTTELLHQLDAAFLQVGEAHGGLLVKFHGGEPTSNENELRAELNRAGLDVPRLESEGRLVFVAEKDPKVPRADALRRFIKEQAAEGRTIWATFDWTQSASLEEALEQQEALTEIANAGQLVIKTALLERVTDEWTAEERRRAQAAHAGMIWLSEAGLSLSRVTPLSAG